MELNTTLTLNNSLSFIKIHEQATIAVDISQRHIKATIVLRRRHIKVEMWVSQCHVRNAIYVSRRYVKTAACGQTSHQRLKSTESHQPRPFDADEALKSTDWHLLSTKLSRFGT